MSVEQKAKAVGLKEAEVDAVRFTQVTVIPPGNRTAVVFVVQEDVLGNDVIHFPESGSIVIKGMILRVSTFSYEPGFDLSYKAIQLSSLIIEFSAVPAMIQRGLKIEQLQWT